MSVIALIVAAGLGARFDLNAPKQYHYLGDKTIMEHCIGKFIDHNMIDKVAVVINKNHEALYQEAISGFRSPEIIYGGDTRQASVYNGLQYINRYNPQHVLIHDAVRPFVSVNLISNVIKQLNNFSAIDVSLPITDTIKTVNNNRIDILNRDNVYLSQTPQGFDYQLIKNLHEKYKTENFTDDISLCIKENIQIGLVPGVNVNIKITNKNDIIYANHLINEVVQ